MSRPTTHIAELLLRSDWANYTPKNRKTTSVVSIEEKVIEKKVIEKKEFNLLNNLDQEGASDWYETIDHQLVDTERAHKIRQLRVVDNRGYTRPGGLELPEAITNLVDNKAYLPRHQKLARDYGVKYLIKLAEIAQTKGKPSRWYAKATSKANWKQTEQMLQSLFKKLDQAREILAKVPQATQLAGQWLNYYAGAFSRLSEAQVNQCVELANSRGAKKPPNLFARSIKLQLDKCH
jgi:hypothetical protein